MAEAVKVLLKQGINLETRKFSYKEVEGAWWALIRENQTSN